jgi:hypothetical protein
MTTLSYASAPTQAVRLWPLAAGAALMALAPYSGLLMYFSPSLIDSRGPAPGALDWGEWREIVTVLYRIMMIAALTLLTAAMVRRPGRDWLRWFGIANVTLLAAVTLAQLAVALAVFVPNPYSGVAGKLWYVLWVAWFPVQLAVLLASMVFLVAGAGRLGHRVVGILAALILVPGAAEPLLWLGSLVDLVTLQSHVVFWNMCANIAQNGGTVVWSAGALTAGVLAWRGSGLAFRHAKA